MIYNTVVKGSQSSKSLGLTAEEWGGTLQNGKIVYNAGKLPDFSGVTNLSYTSCLEYAFYGRGDFTGALDFPAVTSISPNTYAERILYYTFSKAGITSATFSSLTTIEDNNYYSSQAPFGYTFYGCSNLTSLSFPELTTINLTNSEYGFNSICYSCSSMTTVSFPKLRSIIVKGSFAYGMFQYCSNLTTVEFPLLESIENVYKNYYTSMFSSVFYYCTNLETVRFPSLKTVTFDSTASGTGFFDSAFYYCSKLKNVYFNALDTLNNVKTSGFMNNMLSGCTGVTVHFKSTAQSLISSYPAVTNGFGGTNTTVLFDL